MNVIFPLLSLDEVYVWMHQLIIGAQHTYFSLRRNCTPTLRNFQAEQVVSHIFTHLYLKPSEIFYCIIEKINVHFTWKCSWSIFKKHYILIILCEITVCIYYMRKTTIFSVLGLCRQSFLDTFYLKYWIMYMFLVQLSRNFDHTHIVALF